MMGENFAPLVSIIIPVYNGSNYMREAIDSALAQTYENVEIIVVNDGSRDNGETERIAKEYGEKIRYIFKENGGVSTALNTGIKNMRGEYFSWLSHDDVYMPDKIEKQVNALSGLENKSTVICCASIHIDKDSNIIGSMPETKQQNKGLVSWDNMLLRLFKNGPMNGCALMIKKSIFDQVGLFDEDLRFYQDGIMWYKIFMAKYDVLFIPDICVKGRIHGKQLTQTGQSVFKQDCEKTSCFMIPELIEISKTNKKYLVTYIIYNAKYNNINVVLNACVQAKTVNLLKLSDYVLIMLFCCYGMIRPAIRKVYYKMFRNIKTT